MPPGGQCRGFEGWTPGREKGRHDARQDISSPARSQNRAPRWNDHDTPRRIRNDRSSAFQHHHRPTRFGQLPCGIDPICVHVPDVAFEEARGLSKRSAAGKSARFYQGAALYRLGRLDEAIPVLEEVYDFKEPATLKGLSGAMLAEAFVAAGQTDSAVSLLEGMAAEEEPAFPADQALLQLARIHYESGNLAEAQRVWRRIAEEHPQTAGAMEANNLLNNPG
jgi:tetratricopeptide (TPR) repeat protein